jgi:hypothetical protein
MCRVMRHGALLPALPDCPICYALSSRTPIRLSKGDEARRSNKSPGQQVDRD